MIELDRDRFEELVGEALDLIPDELARRMDNVVVTVAEGRPDGLLGLYEGVPLTERESYGGFGSMSLPDRITVYRRSTLGCCSNEAEVVEQVRITVVHEVAHHFGIDDERLDELGWA
jgi:predicted Zn-dependent protease with MMP-like domain